jgi:PleD family two-component response regulator
MNFDSVPDSVKGNILIVDDMPANLRLLVEILTRHGYKTRPATNASLALAAIEKEIPDLILLDIMMPETDGYQLCQQLKADERTADIPVIFISALGEVFDKVKAFSVGGVDYVAKPFKTEEILARIETHLKIQNLQNQLKIANATLADQLQELEQTNAILQQRNSELQEALKTIKTLSGILPVCAWCHKKIKSEDNEWVMLETYIEQHSEAEITHGICPDCVQQVGQEVLSLRRKDNPSLI